MCVRTYVRSGDSVVEPGPLPDEHSGDWSQSNSLCDKCLYPPNIVTAYGVF